MAQRVRNRHFEAPAHHVLGFIGLSSGDFAAAAEHYAAVAACMKAMRWRHPALLVWHGNAVEALLAVGRRAEAVALTDELARLADELDLATSTALALRCRALLAVDAGDLDAATAALDESLSLSEALDNPLEHARTLLVRGVVHRRRHQKALARTDLRHAADTFAHHGAAAWAARAEREHDRSTTLTGTELTASERAVAELAASGATNREIAAALFLSEKTVEAVLTRVYRKLSVHSRIQLGRHPAFAPGSEGRT
jgi:DNA-binding NarL/FixJ family response regulator